LLKNAIAEHKTLKRNGELKRIKKKNGQFTKKKKNQIAGDHPNLKDGVWFGRPPRTLGT
jgi:hypothetical protein